MLHICEKCKKETSKVSHKDSESKFPMITSSELDWLYIVNKDPKSCYNILCHDCIINMVYNTGEMLIDSSSYHCQDLSWVKDYPISILTGDLVKSYMESISYNT